MFNDKTLEYYYIKEGEIVNLLLKSLAPHQAFVSIFPGKLLMLPVELTDTVLSLKEKIEWDHGTPIFQQRLMHHGVDMENSKTLGECNY